jgi:hypothetical protein
MSDSPPPVKQPAPAARAFEGAEYFQVRDIGSLNVLTDRDIAVMRFGWAILGISAAIALALLAYWEWNANGHPHDPLLDDVSKLFDVFVAKSFLPLFATILGYLIGRESASKKS